MADKVRELVWLRLASGRCTIEQVAGQISVDRRTPHRRLATEQSTFSAIVEAARREVVTQTPSSRERSLSSVADLAGFSNLSAFSRWFRGRFGVCPSSWRVRSST